MRYLVLCLVLVGCGSLPAADQLRSVNVTSEEGELTLSIDPRLYDDKPLELRLPPGRYDSVVLRNRSMEEVVAEWKRDHPSLADDSPLPLVLTGVLVDDEYEVIARAGGQQGRLVFEVVVIDAETVR